MMSGTNEALELDSNIPFDKAQEPKRTWKQRLLIAALAAGVVLAMPTEAHAGLFGIFSEIFGTIQKDIGASLSSINRTTQATQQLYREAVWPLALINQARGFVVNTINGYRRYISNVFYTPYRSAVLNSPKQFEQILHSRQAAQIPALGISYIGNYGAVPAVNIASPEDRVMMDIDDALGQENFKTTVIADQNGDLILETANQLESQVAVSTPGSNPYLTAQAQIANLRCQALIQKMLAAELRQEAGRIAHDNALLKRRASAIGVMNNILTGALTRR